MILNSSELEMKKRFSKAIVANCALTKLFSRVLIKNRELSPNENNRSSDFSIVNYLYQTFNQLLLLYEGVNFCFLRFNFIRKLYFFQIQSKLGFLNFELC